MAKQVETIVVGEFQVNSYLYYDDETNDALIIDPGAEASTILSEVERLGCNLRAILLTHGHLDHIGAVSEIKEATGQPILIGKGEEEFLTDPKANGSAAWGNPITAPPADESLSDDDLVVYGSLNLRVLATPGHSPGGICFLDETNGWLFCGDTLFSQSIGRTDLYQASFEILIASIQSKILTLPDTVVCLPGHGPQTTVGNERRSNPFLVGGQFA